MNFNYLFDNPLNYKTVQEGEVVRYYAKCDNKWIELEKEIYDAMVQPIIDQQKYDAPFRRRKVTSLDYLTKMESIGLLTRINNQEALRTHSAEDQIICQENQKEIHALVYCINLCLSSLSETERTILLEYSKAQKKQYEIASEIGKKESDFSKIKNKALRAIKKELESLSIDLDSIDIP